MDINMEEVGEYIVEEEVCDVVTTLEKKIDRLEKIIMEMHKTNKEMTTEFREMKEKFNVMNANQGRVKVQLNLLNKYIEGTRTYFPIENMDKLVEIEEKIMESEVIKAAVETELRRILKAGDKNFLPKIAKPDIYVNFNVTGRGARRNILDFHVFKYSSVMKVERCELRKMVEGQQAKIRQQKVRAEKRKTDNQVQNQNVMSADNVLTEKPAEQSPVNIAPYPDTLILPSQMF
ncbi:uncharacterized protein LOC129806729 isoform X2 [Phlebotomus papatasi]|uniref:uncharacterized protein LOC129806729 isoform X2 n=1 Tax=Phlebotomus papatasi TaxID=29031 RepID=UPI0024838495|nr:uncharacterized protein LOC129806729 isoform X2 [Phlebotomus papatasi]